MAQPTVPVQGGRPRGWPRSSPPLSSQGEMLRPLSTEVTGSSAGPVHDYLERQCMTVVREQQQHFIRRTPAGAASRGEREREEST